MLSCIKIFISLIISVLSLSAVVYAQENSGVCVLPKGTFYRGILQASVSSDYSNEGDVVRIINPHDIFIGKKLCIPKNSMFLGTVNYVQPSKQGVNGAFSVKFDTLVYPSSQKVPINGMIWSKNNGIIGGEFAPKSAYRTVLHRTQGLSGVQVLVPHGEGMMGQETKPNAGEEVNIILNEEVLIKF